MSAQHKKKVQLNAINVRILLSLGLVATSLISAAGFIAINALLQSQVNDLANSKQDVEASSKAVTSLQSLEDKIESSKKTIEKANLLRDSSRFPEFSIIDNVSKIARDNNLRGVSYSYADSGSGDTTGESGTEAAPAAPTPPAPEGAATSATPGPAPQAAQVGNTLSVTVTFESDVSYVNLMRFLSDIENALPKMQVKGLSISPGESANRVKVEPITIEMYTK